MKKFLIPIGIVVVLAVQIYRAKQSPAAEDRVRMDQVAHRTSDSIQHWLDSSLNDPAKEMGGTLPYQATPGPANIVTVTNAPAHK